MESTAALTLSIFVASITLAIISYFIKKVLDKVDVMCTQFGDFRTYCEKTFATKNDLDKHKTEVSTFQNDIVKKMLDALVDLKK